MAWYESWPEILAIVTAMSANACRFGNNQVKNTERLRGHLLISPRSFFSLYLESAPGRLLAKRLPPIGLEFHFRIQNHYINWLQVR